MDIGGYVYSEPTAIQALTVDFEYRWSAPSLIATLVVSGLTSIDEPRSDKIYYNRTLRVEVTFPEAVKVRAALADMPYGDMPYVISDEAKTTHISTIVLPPESEGLFTLFIKTATQDDLPGAYISQTQFWVGKAPTGQDTKKLLRLRKFSKDGAMSRWDGALVRSI